MRIFSIENNFYSIPLRLIAALAIFVNLIFELKLFIIKLIIKQIYIQNYTDLDT
jgi:hypothetical protein